MKYKNIKKGIFVSRPNRFIANVIIDGKAETAHVKNTGRCKELLIEGVNVYCQRNENAGRKTKWSLIGVEKGKRLVNIDSRAPNIVFHEWLLEGNFLKNIKEIKPEFKYKDSRIDFMVETDTEKALIEIKGVTLEEDGVAMFPDAPTERGVRHIFELCRSLDEGYTAYVIFVIQMKGVRYFTPNVKTHKAFADALVYAEENRVKILAVDCEVGEDRMSIKDEVKVVLKPDGVC
ncbi:MAG TPA: DNA/RNA nuclease SfsA [Clostridiaceae bacterium]|nr:DNA/RNA nuclease SfsA [Clostridiaceae bacterium]